MIYNTAGQSIASIYNLGGIFTSGRTYILAIELPTILYITYYIAKAGVTLAKMTATVTVMSRFNGHSSCFVL